MKILGVDPGSQITGYGIIEQQGQRQIYLGSGCIRIGLKTWPERLKTIFEGLSQIITHYDPHILAIERVFVHKNVSSALKLGQARGAAITAAAMQNLSMVEYAAREVKKAIVGYGGAEKIQMQHMIQQLLNLSGLPQRDAADALAIALCHGQHAHWENRRINL